MDNSTPPSRRAHLHGESDPMRHVASSLGSLAPSSADESWVEVSSRPSSSSLSSIADDIITTGLRVQHTAPKRRRHSHRSLRGSMSAARPRIEPPSRHHGHGAESESDRVNSSAEGSVQPSPRLDWTTFEGRASGASSGNAYASEEDCNENDDDDENATAIGISLAETTSYRPPPNAFSRPTTATRHMSLQQYSSSSRSYRPRSQRRTQSSSSQHSPYNVISPSHHVDHEAALRASLSTLLSCAAAARGLPRPNSLERPETIPETVPETLARDDAPQNVLQQQPPVEFKVTTIEEEMATLDKGKRKAPQSSSQGTAQVWSSKDRRSAKKPRRSVVTTRTMEDITPTLLTWVVGAGMLVLVSAISFSAGYVTGREAGHAEAAGAAGVGVGVGAVKRNLASNRGSGLGLRRSIGAAAGICV